MSPVRLSIITACRNAEHFITGCLENVAEQGTRGIEHIIVDGASTDGTPELIRRFGGRHPHVRWISEPDNGQSQAMNKGLAMAQGKIVGFLNADDLYRPGVLQRVLEIFSTLGDLAFVVGNCDLVSRSGRVVKRSCPVGLTFQSLLAGEVIPPLNPTSYFYHKRLHVICGNYDEDEHNFMDIKMLPRLLQIASLHYYNEDWGIFRLHPLCKTSNNWSKGNIMWKIDRLLVDYLNTLPETTRKPILARRLGPGQSPDGPLVELAGAPI